jgi:hypothetical protein
MVGGALYVQPSADNTPPTPTLITDTGTPVSPGVEMMPVSEEPSVQATAPPSSSARGDGSDTGRLVQPSRASGQATAAGTGGGGWVPALSSLLPAYAWTRAGPPPDTGSDTGAITAESAAMCAEIQSRMDAALRGEDGCGSGCGSATRLTSSDSGGGALKDLLALARRVDELEDSVCTLQAEKDQAEARVAIARVHVDGLRADKENAVKAQVRYCMVNLLYTVVLFLTRCLSVSVNRGVLYCSLSWSTCYPPRRSSSPLWTGPSWSCSRSTMPSFARAWRTRRSCSCA